MIDTVAVLLKNKASYFLKRFQSGPCSVKLDERFVLVFCAVILFSGKQNIGSHGAVAGREC